MFQNILEFPKNKLFGVGPPEHKNWATAKMSASYLRHFLLEKDILCPETSAKLFGRFPAGRSKFRPYSTSGWQEKCQKIDFFEFLKFSIQIRLDLDSRCKTLLKHLRDPFPAINHHSGQYRPLYKNLNFLPKSIFERFCNF